MDNNAKYQKAYNILSIIPDSNIIRSEAFGVWTVSDCTKDLEAIISLAGRFAGQKWAFMGIIENMAPIVNEEVHKAFSRYHTEFEKIGCVAIAFIVGGNVAINVQAHSHHNVSGVSKLLINHFRTEEQAVEWFKTLGV